MKEDYEIEVRKIIDYQSQYVTRRRNNTREEVEREFKEIENSIKEIYKKINSMANQFYALEITDELEKKVNEYNLFTVAEYAFSFKNSDLTSDRSYSFIDNPEEHTVAEKHMKK